MVTTLVVCWFLHVYCIRLKHCKTKGWNKYGYGALDLMHIPSSDSLLSRTNVSGTSPKFDYCESLLEINLTVKNIDEALCL